MLREVIREHYHGAKETFTISRLVSRVDRYKEGARDVGEASGLTSNSKIRNRFPHRVDQHVGKPDFTACNRICIIQFSCAEISREPSKVWEKAK